MAIDDKLNELIQIKSDIKDAIVDKGVEMPDGLPFNQYASKVNEISGGGERGEIINFDIAGNLECLYGIGRDFVNNSKYFYNTWNDCTQDVIIKLKFKTPHYLPGDTVITSCDESYNFDLNSGRFTVWSYRDKQEFIPLIPSTDTWYYVCIKITNLETEMMKQIYISTTGFSTDASALKVTYYDYKGTNDHIGYIGCDGAKGRAWRGIIDMNECYITDHSGNMLKRLYAVNTMGD